MGLIKAALGSAGGVMADQWKEFFYCEALPMDVLAAQQPRAERTEPTVPVRRRKPISAA